MNFIFKLDDPRIDKAAFYLKVRFGLGAFGERIGGEAFSIEHK
jgi:hypothetical protein